MGTLEIGLIIIGIIFVTISFFIREKEPEQTGTDSRLAEEEIRDMAESMMKDMLENTEAKLDKIANQKIMAVGNYSEDVLKNIEDNHNEVMFLYNMLNDKETTLKNTVRDIEAVKVSVRKMAEEAPKKEEIEVIKEEIKVEDQIQRERFEGHGREEISESESKKQILELYRQGRTNVEIAQELNLGVGEVNLVLGLYKSQEQGKDEKKV